jgi:hypothetical protein
VGDGVGVAVGDGEPDAVDDGEGDAEADDTGAGSPFSHGRSKARTTPTATASATTPSAIISHIRERPGFSSEYAQTYSGCGSVIAPPVPASAARRDRG